ncbi:MAG TPA: Mut7-C RNAse domain-containing protein [Verrucomicrobiae bacterium]|nr:Mut7-C RNAse domain-containing protein [Verrucomicrobiae bacterium]
MSRIQRAFERRFNELLGELGTRDRQKGVRWIFARAHDSTGEDPMELSRGLTEQNIRLVEKVHRYRKRKGFGEAQPGETTLICDAGLGGLARWLRASGCDARWRQDISDSDLVAEADRLQARIITTDSFLLDRRAIAQGAVRATWVPPTLNKFEQLRLVRAELDLPTSESRCMGCGGELVKVPKEDFKGRIPSKTYAWVDEYYQCSRCEKLFWQGTHWKQVSAALEKNRGTG